MKAITTMIGMLLLDLISIGFVDGAVFDSTGVKSWRSVPDRLANRFTTLKEFECKTDLLDFGP